MKSYAWLFVAMLLFTLGSCKKDEITESYMRGGNSLLKTADGNMLITGFNAGGNGGYDGYLTKVDLAGNVLWSNFFGGYFTDGLYNAINATGGGYVATGFTSNSSMNQPGIAIVKIGDQGTAEWITTFNDTSFSVAFSVAATRDSGYIACGYIQNDRGSDRDIYLVKVNAKGAKVWTKRFVNTGIGSYNDEAYSITSAGDSAFYVTGSMNGNFSCCGHMFLMKINTTGDSLWTKTYSQGLGFSVAYTTDGGAVIGGSKEENGGDICLLKADSEGTQTWEKTFGTTAYDYGTAVIQTTDGGYAVTGVSTVSSDQNIVLIKTDATGASQWSKTYGGTGIEQGFGLIQHTDDGYSVTGMSNTDGSFIYLNRTNESGVEIWQKNLK